MGVNTNLDQKVVIDTTSASFDAGLWPGIQRQVLDAYGLNQTSIIEVDDTTVLPSDLVADLTEVFVISGGLDINGSLAESGAYLRDLWALKGEMCAHGDTRLYARKTGAQATAAAPTMVETAQAQFYPGLVPGLSVFPLFSEGGENTALVRWQPGTHFNPHRHWGGEEILVLEGVFSDEHGRFPAGTWMRSPHLSQHTPFTEEGALILVKTGHLPSDVTQSLHSAAFA